MRNEVKPMASQPNAKKYNALFEQQSYQDALTYYLETLKEDNCQGGAYKHPIWDYVILTASNEAQALAYNVQIQHRQSQNQLPKGTKFVVIPDLEGKRIGSGGATFSAIRYIYQQEKTFRNKRVLCIHSGGDSKRVPQYSACGKLFSPVPRILPDGRRSTLFDELLIGMSTVAPRIGEGMLICSGDVLILFNALQIDFYGAGAAALSVKENVNTGKDHGVFLRDDKGMVGRFLHKQTVETLRSVGAVDEKNYVDIDTGAIILSGDMLDGLYRLVEKEEDYLSIVNEKARVSFYADFLYPLATDSTLEQFYKETPEGEFTEELKKCRTRLWETLHPYSLKLIRLSPASFIHFGTTEELRKLMTEEIEDYQFLGWERVVSSNIQPEHFAISNSYVSRESTVGAGSYIEDSRIHKGSVVGKNCVISGVTLTGETIPDGTVVHGLKLKDGRFVVRMYGVTDNPKENRLFGEKLEQPLWTEKRYPICDSITEAVSRTVKGDTAGCECISLEESFNRADVTAILPWQENLYQQVVGEAILDMIAHQIPAEEVKKRYPLVSDQTVNYLTEKAESLNGDDLQEFGVIIRIYSYLSKLTVGKQSDKLAQKCLTEICNATLRAAAAGIRYNPTLQFAQDETVVNLPVRVNWGGGWSDTPPYCMEHGGTVLNAAISLNGKLPIEVTIQKLDKPCIALASTDIGTYQEFTCVAPLQNCKNPSDPFALHKAALIACGVIPREGEIALSEILERIGGGIYLNTRVIDIPKGSGLGTSSILAGACVKAVSQAFGLNWADNELYERALCMEQLMSTGGGWQDQVGGIAPGIKMVTTKPGLKQEISCTACAISEETRKELNDRFYVIYTGQRRLARNLLREVITKRICNDPVSVEAHYNIQRLAVLMRFELEKGNVDGFAKLLNENWEENKRIDAGCTNTCIDQIFLTVEDLVAGKMICGAGGGGFLQVILKKGVSVEMLRERLREVFRDSGVDVWDCDIV